MIDCPAIIAINTPVILYRITKIIENIRTRMFVLMLAIVYFLISLNPLRMDIIKVFSDAKINENAIVLKIKLYVAVLKTSVEKNDENRQRTIPVMIEHVAMNIKDVEIICLVWRSLFFSSAIYLTTPVEIPPEPMVLAMLKKLLNCPMIAMPAGPTYKATILFKTNAIAILTVVAIEVKNDVFIKSVLNRCINLVITGR